MKLVILGTNHEIQEKDYEGTDEFRSVLKYLIREHNIEHVMEEWTSTKGSTVGQRLSSELNITWSNVGPPSAAKFRTHIPLCDPLEEPPMVIDRLSPLPVHIKREEFMVAEIYKAMIGRTHGLFVVGLAHMQSMSVRLLGAGFNVEAFNWTMPPLRS